jgi:hypothetical protein
VIDYVALVPKIDAILNRGLSKGLGVLGGQVCVEAAICEALGLPHGDDPGCVDDAVRAYKIYLNDSPWSSPQARAAGLRDLAIAQLGTRGAWAFEGHKFSALLAEKTVRVLIPALFREISTDEKMRAGADRCENEGTPQAAAEAARAAAEAARAAARAAVWAVEAAARTAEAAATQAARATEAAARAAEAAEAVWDAETEAAQAARGAAQAARAAEAAAGTGSDKYLLLSAKLALDTLRDMGAPGVKYL